jgi:mono/diheme cytochrome c family protein
MRSLVRNLLATSVLLVTGAGALFVAKAVSGVPEKSAEDIYTHDCAICHGKDGAGKTTQGKRTKVKDIRDTIKTTSEEEMIKVVQKGKGADMDAYRDELKADQIKAVVEYYRGLAKK